MAFQITEVQKSLKGVDYPASKDELAATAAIVNGLAFRSRHSRLVQ